MVAVDTNVLIRLLVDDPGAVEQIEQARKSIQTAEQVYIPQIVQVECVWVLQSGYKFSKQNIVDRLGELAGNIRFVLQNSPSFLRALALFQGANADFSDCLILVESQAAECHLITFDKRLATQGGVRLLSAQRLG